MTERKLVVFDFDGTLVNSEPHFAAGLAEFSRMNDLSFDVKKMTLGYVDPTKYDLGWNIPLEDQLAMMKRYTDYLEFELLEKKRFMPDLFDDVFDILTDLQKKYDLGLVTVRDRPTTLAALAHHGMSHFFPVYRTHCCAKERGYPIKPAPDALHDLLDELNYKPENVVMIGDTNSDIEMANAAGAKSIAVSWGLHPPDKILAANPTLFVTDIQELPSAITKIFSL